MLKESLPNARALREHMEPAPSRLTESCRPGTTPKWAVPEECVVEPGGIELPTSRCLSSSLAVDRRRHSQRTACSHRKRRQTQARAELDVQVHRPPGPAATRP